VSTEWINRLSRPEGAFLFFLRISGIPVLFSHAPVPSAWGTPLVVNWKGEVYQWSETLVLSDDLGSTSTKAEPKSGLARSGKMDFSFYLRGTGEADPGGDIWQGYLNKNHDRPDEGITNLRATLGGSGETSIPVNGTTNFNNLPVPVYIGTETLVAGGSNTADEIKPINTRGAYGSWAQSFRVLDDATNGETAGGAFVSSWPLVLRGRYVELYMCVGRWWKDEFDPVGLAMDDTRQIYKGIVNKTSEGDDTLTFVLGTAAIDQVLNKRFATRLPLGKPIWTAADNARHILNHIYIGPHNHYMHLIWTWTDNSDSILRPRKIAFDVLLRTSGGNPVAEGTYGIDTIAEFVKNGLNHDPDSYIARPNGDEIVTSVYFQRSGIAGKDTRLQLRLRTGSATNGATNRFYWIEMLLESPGRNVSFLRDLGWSENLLLEASTDPAQTHGQAFFVSNDAEEAPLAFRWPAREQAAPNRIYYVKQQGPDFDPSPGWLDDSGAAIGGLVKIGDNEIVKISGLGSLTARGLTVRWLEVAARGVMDTGEPEPLIQKLEPGSDRVVEFVQGVGFTGTSWPRAAAYILHSGSGESGLLHTDLDRGWRGSGLALPDFVADIDQWLAIAPVLNSRRERIWFDEPTTLKDFLADELVISSAVLLATAEFVQDTGYRMRIIEIGHGSEHSFSDARQLTEETNIATLKGGNVGVDRNEELVINHVSIRAGYNPATGKFLARFENFEHTSIDSWGKGATLKIDIKTISGAADQELFSRAIAAQVFSLYAHPYGILALSAARLETITWQVTDLVEITHSKLWRYDKPGRGITNLRGRLMVKRDEPLGRQGISSRLTMVVDISGRRRAAWGPTAILDDEQADGFQYSVFDHGLSSADLGDPYDITAFKVGYRVRVFRAGSTLFAQAAITAVVDSAGGDDGELRFDFDLTAFFGTVPSGQLYVIYDNHAETSPAQIAEAQRVFSVWSDGSGELDTGVGGDERDAFTYD